MLLTVYQILVKVIDFFVFHWIINDALDGWSIAGVTNGLQKLAVDYAR